MDFGHLTGLHLGERNDPLTVCTLREDVASLLSARVVRVTLSYETLQKQRESHSTLGLDYYRALPPALALGAYYRDGPRTAVVYFTDTYHFMTNFRVAIKATGTGDELYVLSFFKLRDADLRAQLRKVRRLGWPCLKEHD